jgi:hypothetical protein
VDIDVEPYFNRTAAMDGGAGVDPSDNANLDFVLAMSEHIFKPANVD